MDRRASLAAPSIRIKIPDQLPTLFEPQKTMVNPHIRPSVDGGGDVASPERRLTVLALQLAVLEKAASWLGTLAFIWATVVLLGGFAITLGRTDFWCITVLLLIEGTRILGRSHELEWQHQATWQPPVSWSVVRVFSWMQLLSASACVSLSLVCLLYQHYGGSPHQPPRRAQHLLQDRPRGGAAVPRREGVVTVVMLSIFAHLCEAFLGVQSPLDLFRYYYNLRRIGNKIVGGASFRLREEKIEEYIDFVGKSFWSG